MLINAGNYPLNHIPGPSGSLGPNAAPAGSSSVAVSEKNWDQSNDTYTLSSTKEKYVEAIVRDMNNGRLTPEAKELVDALLTTDKPNTQKVQVKTFAVNGIQANNIILIERVPPTPNGTNHLLYLPQNDGDSFFSFKNGQEMNDWLKHLITDPNKLETLLSHFPPHLHSQIKDSLIQFEKNDVNAVVGPYAYEGDDVFSRLDNAYSAPPAPVNGLTDLRLEKEGADGRLLFSGKRPNGETVYYEYDAYGNFQGEDRKGNFYFVKNGLNRPEMLSPLTAGQFRAKITSVAQDNVGANDVKGLYQEFLHHLENPAYGISDALQSLGINKDAANTVERYLDNPFTALLLDLNKNNMFGKLFGVDKETMDKDLTMVGGIAQGFIPYYGQARVLGSLTAKALRNEPLTDEEKRDMADAMALKPGSQARRNLQSPSSEVKSSLKKSPFDENKPVEKPSTKSEPEHTTALPPTGAEHPGMVKIEYNGSKKYYVADTPDAGDGEHYLLRVEDPNDPSKLVSSGIIAKPDETGVWQKRGVKGGGWPKKPKEPNNNTLNANSPEGFMEGLLKQRNETPGAYPRVRSVADIKKADFPIPEKIYRAHTGAESKDSGLRRAAGTELSGDDYLAAIIKHTARQGGSGGEVMSFSASKAKAQSFSTQYLKDGKSAPVYTIDTTRDPQAFRTIPDIILKDGERLVREGKITKATLLKATDEILNYEKEVFYIKGDVPPALIVQ